MWADETMVSLDFETTGVNVETDRVVTASIVVVRPGEAPTVHEWLAKPTIPIPAGATAVHGITTEHAEEHGQPAAQVLREVWQTLSAELTPAPLIVCNAPYDISLLDREMRRHWQRGWDMPRPVQVVDPLVIDKAVDKYRKGSRKLTAMCAHYGITLTEEDAHGSTADALAAARLVWKIAHKYPDMCDDLDMLQVRQIGWCQQQADSFTEYRRRKGEPVDGICGDWPYRPVAVEAMA
jgi:DNA polymerase III subunit epsilon